MIYKGSFILQHTELKEKKQQMGRWLTDTGESRKEQHEKENKFARETGWRGWVQGGEDDLKNTKQYSSSWCPGTGKDLGSTTTASVA